MLKRADKKFGREDLTIMGVNVMAKDKRLVKAYRRSLVSYSPCSPATGRMY
jgi:hypothetical protein